MPNVNLLPTINSATNNNAYFVVSNNGLVRRFKYENFISQIQQTLPDVNRTDQNLFTNTDVSFRSVTLSDQVPSFLDEYESQHGFQTEVTHIDGSGIKTNDILGAFRVGGFDGNNNIIKDNRISSAGITVFATQDWANSGTVTTNAGSTFQFYHQPINLQLSAHSRTSFLTVTSTQTNSLSNPTTYIRIGAVSPSGPVQVTTSTDGTATYNGVGRADITFVNSRIAVAGLPAEDTNPVNPTVTATNVLVFTTGRYDVSPGRRQPIRENDTLGLIEFLGVNSTSTITNSGVLTAAIRAYATCDYTSGQYGAAIRIRAASSQTNQLYTCLEIQPEGNFYNSDFHRFSDKSYDGGSITITSGTVVFNDQSIQSTAYQGFVSAPTSSSSPGNQGQMSYDSSYFYICVAPNHWKRIAAQDF
jgi:hypothetical protein